MERTEFVTPGNCEPAEELAPGVILRVFVSGRLGAHDLTTCSATIRPRAPAHPPATAT